MREVGSTCILVLILAVLGISALSVLGAESVESSDSVALRISTGIYGFPISSSELTLEGALGLCDVSVAAWVELQALPISIFGFGGELSLTKEWLSLSLSADQSGEDCALQLIGRADPPGWLLLDGDFSLVLCTTSSVRTQLSKSLPDSEIALSPYLTGVFSVSGMIVKPSIGWDLVLGPQTPCPSVSGSRVSSAVDVGGISISSSVQFTGCFDVFSSLIVSINMPDCGLVVSGSLIPTEIGGFRYRIGASYEYGNASLLPVRVGTPGQVCTGDVCY